VIVDEDEREGVRPVDVPVDEIEVPEVVRADGLVALGVGVPLDLGGR